MEPTTLPRFIDQPQTLLFWSADEIVPFSVLFAVGIATNHLLIFMLLGFGASYYLRRFRDSRPDGYLFHALYWYGFAPIKGRCAINPFHRRVLPE